MFGQKLFFVASLLAIASVVSVYAVPNSHNFTLGYRLPGDQLFLTQNVEVKSKLWQIVTLEKSFNTTKFTRITKVEAIDRRTDGTGATVSWVRGGPSYQNVTLRFKSQRNHGIHFRINLYAR